MSICKTTKHWVDLFLDPKDNHISWWSSMLITHPGFVNLESTGYEWRTVQDLLILAKEVLEENQ